MVLIVRKLTLITFRIFKKGQKRQTKETCWKVVNSPSVLEKTLESPLDCKEIQPVHLKGDQSWVFMGRTDAEAESPILWPPHVKS